MHKTFFLLFLILNLNILYSNNLNLWSQSAIVIDYDTEQILYEKNIDLKIPPASMTKLVTIYMTYNFLKREKIDIDTRVSISKNADWRNLPRDSSLMFIEEGQLVTFRELLIGLAIPSGNDAAIAIAEAVSGSVDNFVKDMNNEMTNLGFKTIKFVEPSGYEDENVISVREFSEFCLLFTKKYPHSLDELFSLESYTYPKKHNGYTSIGGIKQYNRNPMIDLYPGCDGLKTGFIYKSGMNVSLTATKDNRRVITVIAGVKDSNKENAERKRIVDSTKLLDFGLNKKNIYLDKIELPSIKVNNGKSKSITPYIPYKSLITKGNIEEISYSIDSVTAPIYIGDKLGYVYFKLFNKSYSYPIYSKENINIESHIKYLFNK